MISIVKYLFENNGAFISTVINPQNEETPQSDDNPKEEVKEKAKKVLKKAVSSDTEIPLPKESEHLKDVGSHVWWNALKKTAKISTEHK
jgi:hypothetical protein